MARKASQSVKDRLQRYKKTVCRRSFFDALPAEAQEFMQEIRTLYNQGELDLGWNEIHDACKREYPKARWPARPQTVAIWIRGEV